MGYRTRHKIKQLKGLIMATQAELSQQISQLSTQLERVHTEITDKVTNLEQKIQESGNVSQEVTTAMEQLKSRVQLLDDITPDTPSPTPGDNTSNAVA